MRAQLIAIRDQFLAHAASIDAILAFLFALEEPAAPQRRKRRGGATRRTSQRPVKRLKRRAKRRPPIAPGSVEDRVVEILGEGPQKFPALVESCKAPASAVRKALDQLIVDRRVEREGKSRGTVYQKAAA